VKVERFVFCDLCNNWTLFVPRRKYCLASFYTASVEFFLGRLGQTVLYIMTEKERLSYWIYHYDIVLTKRLFTQALKELLMVRAMKGPWKLVQLNESVSWYLNSWHFVSWHFISNPGNLILLQLTQGLSKIKIS